MKQTYHFSPSEMIRKVPAIVFIMSLPLAGLISCDSSKGWGEEAWIELD